MTTQERRADAESRLRRAFVSLGAARVLLSQKPPCRDDGVNRASAAALHAARALVDSQWARDSQPYWDPDWRPGMPRSNRIAIDRYSAGMLHRLLDRFDQLASGLKLPQDFTLYLRTLIEDGLDADAGESPEYDAQEATEAVETAQRLVASVAEVLELGGEFRIFSATWAPVAQHPVAATGMSSPSQLARAATSAPTRIP